MSRALRLPASLLLAICSASVSGQGWPPEIKNLKVLPADTTAEQVIGQMRNFTFALGVRCQYCHVGEEGQQLSQFRLRRRREGDEGASSRDDSDDPDDQR